MLNIAIVNNIDSTEWDELLQKSNHATVFHTQEWIHSIIDTYPNCTVKYIIARIDDELVGGLPVITPNIGSVSKVVTPKIGFVINGTANHTNFANKINLVPRTKHDLAKISKYAPKLNRKNILMLKQVPPGDNL